MFNNDFTMYLDKSCLKLLSNLEYIEKVNQYDVKLIGYKFFDSDFGCFNTVKIVDGSQFIKSKELFFDNLKRNIIQSGDILYLIIDVDNIEVYKVK